MFSYPSGISNFHSFDCALAPQLGSLMQKCDPDWRAKIRIKIVYVFFTHQVFTIFIPLAVPWGPNLNPCGKSAILTGARKMHIKVVSAFLPIRHFQFSFLWLFLGVPSWILAAKV